MWNAEWPIVKRGMWLYDGSVPSQIRIQQGDILYGSGDYDDPAEVREDRRVACFYVWYESPPGSNKYPAGSGAFLSLAEAIEDVQAGCQGTVQWEE